MDKQNGLVCDGGSECSSGYCWGISTSSYVCQNSLASSGKYSPESSSCGSGTTWNSGTKECEEDIIDSDEDGYNDGIDCNDNDDTVWQYLTGWKDNDDDESLGISEQVCSGSSLPSNYLSSSSSNIDCNDNDDRFNSNTKWYEDEDGDDYVKSLTPLTQCINPDVNKYRVEHILPSPIESIVIEKITIE